MAYKDEFEVARLHTDPAFLAKLDAQFKHGYTVKYNLAPPTISKRDPITGELQKRQFGPWMMTAFKMLAKFKGLRGGALDIFSKTEERRHERQLIEDYVKQLDEIAGKLNAANHAIAVQLASVPDEIRGYGHVKERNIKAAKALEEKLLRRVSQPAAGAAGRLTLNRGESMNVLNGHDIEDLKVGMTATFAKTITEADIVLFAGVSGDNNAMHINEEFAASTVFKGRIAHGMLSASVISAAIANKLPGPGTIYMQQSLVFKAPVTRRRHRARESLGEQDVAGEAPGVPRYRLLGSGHGRDHRGSLGEGRFPRMTDRRSCRGPRACPAGRAAQ